MNQKRVGGMPPVSIMGNSITVRVCTHCGQRVKQSERYTVVGEMTYHQQCYRKANR